jgi:transcriptional regulator with XRE-family HTH domain
MARLSDKEFRINLVRNLKEQLELKTKRAQTKEEKKLYTQSEFARRADISVSSLKNYLDDTKTSIPSAYNLYCMAHALDTTPDRLIGVREPQSDFAMFLIELGEDIKAHDAVIKVDSDENSELVAYVGFNDKNVVNVFKQLKQLETDSSKFESALASFAAYYKQEGYVFKDGVASPDLKAHYSEWIKDFISDLIDDITEIKVDLSENDGSLLSSVNERLREHLKAENFKFLKSILKRTYDSIKDLEDALEADIF